MKQLLLYVLLLFIATSANAQATAYEVPDINQCGYEIFDLTAQIPAALGNQDPLNFTVTFFTSEADAAANVAAIANPTAYVPDFGSHIFLRVTNIINGDFDITDFYVIVTSGSSVGFFEDVTVCDVYVLPPLSVGNYYTGPGGTGTQIFPGDVITTTQTIYAYYTNGTCTSEQVFTVTVMPTPVAPEVVDVLACVAYTLPALPDGFGYYTSFNGTGSQIPAGSVITASQTIFVVGTNNFCTTEASFTVTINGGGANLILPNPLAACDVNMTGYATFDLTTAQTEFEANNPNILVTGMYANYQDAINGVNPLSSSFTNTVPQQQTIFVAVAMGDCTTTLLLELVVIPCGTTSTLTGTVTLDADGNGCGAGDSPAAGIQVSYNYGNFVFNAYTDVNGNYTFTNVPEGSITLWLQNINGQGFTAFPDAVTINLPGGNTVNDFCVSVPQPYTDVAAYLIPYSQAVPGFAASYAVTVVNYGTQTATGSISFSYDNTLLSLANAGGGVASGNILTWAYNNLAPYQSITYYVVLNVMTPPTVISGTELIFSVAASVSGTDANGSNNAYIYSQYAVNSFDPNDIAVREGEFITEAQADGFLHYTIRFQNTGTANAQNVRVNLPLDENLDWNTFQPITASHTFQANREAGLVNFMFDNIQLPFEDADAAGSNGFVSFRIKPAADIQLNDTMSETAYIYFDFNEAIVTNTVTTTVGALATDGFTKANAALYPNPASGVVNLKINGTLSANANLTITDILGKTILSMPVKSENAAVNISGLTGGVYFVTVQNDATQSTQKLIIK